MSYLGSVDDDKINFFVMFVFPVIYFVSASMEFVGNGVFVQASHVLGGFEPHDIDDAIVDAVDFSGVLHLIFDGVGIYFGVKEEECIF